MKQFSRIKRSHFNDCRLVLLRFDFQPDEDPVAELHSLGLEVICDIADEDKAPEPGVLASAFLITDREEMLRNGQERLRRLGWQEMPAEENS
jgi:hypothetical protein